MPLPRLLEVAAVSDAELRARFVRDGFVKLDGAFPQALAARLARAAFDDGGGASYYRAMPSVDLPTDGSSECSVLERAVEALLDEGERPSSLLRAAQAAAGDAAAAEPLAEVLSRGLEMLKTSQ